MDLIIKNGKVVNHSETVSAAVGVDKGKIVAIGPADVMPSASRTIDAAGKWVLPGAIDLHMHIAYGEYFKIPFAVTVPKETGAAALGGVTTAASYMRRVGTGLLPQFEALKKDFESNAYIDGFFHMMVADEPNLEQIEKAPPYGIYGFKFMMGYKGPQAASLGIPAIDDGFVWDGFTRIAKLGFPCVGMVHAENIDISLRIRKYIEAQGRQDPMAWFDTRPNFVEQECIRRAIFLSKVTKCPLYIVHNTIKESVDEIAQAKADGVNVTMETCPQYLTFTSDNPPQVIKDNPTFINANPPLRMKADVERLWEGVRDGVVDTLASDHAACTREQKGKDMWKAPMGFGGASQFIVPVLISEGVNKGRIPIEKVADVCSYRPAKTFGFYPQKGAIAVGSDADFVIVDPKKKVKFTASMSPSLADWSIWEGFNFTGYPEMTIVRGEVVAQDLKLVGKQGHGKYILPLK